MVLRSALFTLLFSCLRFKSWYVRRNSLGENNLGAYPEPRQSASTRLFYHSSYESCPGHYAFEQQPVDARSDQT